MKTKIKKTKLYVGSTRGPRVAAGGSPTAPRSDACLATALNMRAEYRKELRSVTREIRGLMRRVERLRRRADILEGRLS